MKASMGGRSPVAGRWSLVDAGRWSPVDAGREGELRCGRCAGANEMERLARSPAAKPPFPAAAPRGGGGSPTRPGIVFTARIVMPHRIPTWAGLPPDYRHGSLSL